MTISEIDVLRQQIAGCWNIAAGARQAEALSVEIEMRMNQMQLFERLELWMELE